MKIENTVSIIVPAKNEEKHIEKCVKSLLKLNYQHIEIIIINDGSTDKTGQILEKYRDKIKIITLNGQGPGKARNLAVKEAKGRFIAFTDADCRVDIEWVDELLIAFNDPVVQGVGGSQKTASDETKFGRLVGKFFNTFGFSSDYIQNKSRISPVNHNPTCNVMYRREVFDNENFTEDLWPCEDLELDLRLVKKGIKLVNNPKAIVYHYRPANFISFMKMMSRYGRAHAKLLNKRGFCQNIHYIPLIIFLFAALNVILYRGGINRFMLLYALIIPLGLGYIYLRNKSVDDTVKVLLLIIAVIAVWLYGYFAGAAEEFLNSK